MHVHTKIEVARLNDLDSNLFEFNSNVLSKYKVLKSPKMLGIWWSSGKLKEFTVKLEAKN